MYRIIKYYEWFALIELLLYNYNASKTIKFLSIIIWVKSSKNNIVDPNSNYKINVYYTVIVWCKLI